MATPHVTGATALYLSDHPSDSPAQVATALVSAASTGVVTNPGNVIQTYTVDAPSETANGTWKLRVSDNAYLDTGYIDSWALQF